MTDNPIDLETLKTELQECIALSDIPKLVDTLITEVEALRAEHQQDLKDATSNAADVLRHYERAEAAEALNRKMQEALEFYGDEDNWKSPSKGFVLQYDPEPAPAQDHGRKARAALAKAKPK